MAKTVSWTDAAWADLEAVADSIARDSRYYAAAFVREVREAARSLKRFPERGTIVAELADPTIRELYVRDYRLLYHVTGRQVSILGFIHGARDLAALWKKEGAVPNDLGLFSPGGPVITPSKGYRQEIILIRLPENGPA